MKQVKCDNCEWTGDSTGQEGENEIQPIRDFWSRVDVGGEVPAGDCPKCGAFCYLVDNPHKAKAAPELLEALEAAAVSEHHTHCSSRKKSINCNCHVGKARAAIAKARSIVNERATPLPKPNIIIEVKGGLVQAVTLDGEPVSAEIHDYDIDGAHEPELIRDDQANYYILHHC